MADNIVRLKFGVLGGGEITGASGKQILRDIQQITERINNSKATKLKFSLDVEEITKEADEAYQKAANGVKKLANGSEAATSSNKKLLSGFKQQYNLLGRLSRYMNKYEAGLKKIGKLDEFKGLYDGIKDGSITVADGANALAKLQLEAKTAGAETQTLVGQLKNLLKIDFKQLVSTAALNLLRRTLREIYNDVVNLDKAVVNLSMVTGYSRDKTKELVASYSDMAQELGAITSEVASAADDWLRQGYSLEDTNELVKTSMVLSKIGLIDSAEATQYLTSATKGYKIEASDAMSVADKLSAVDMAAAVSVSGLAEGMSKTANSARLAGVEMDTLLGYLAAVGEVTQQDMSSVGNAFKTMFARYSNVKLNKLVDDDGESLNDYERILTRVGITLRDNAGSFRDFDDVLVDVQNRWSSLTEVEQSAIATALGATRQKENVLTLMENYSKAMEYAGISADSAGTAMEKYDAYSQGIEANMARVKASSESLSSNILNSDAVVNIVKFANTLIKIVDALAQCKLLLPAIVAAFMTIKNVGLSNNGGIYPRNALAVTLNESSRCDGKRALRKTTDTGASNKRIAA